MDKALPSGGRDCGFESRLGLFFVRSKDWYERLHGAMATRRIPDPKIGGSIPSGVSSFFCFSFRQAKKALQSRESNPGLLRDRQEY
jgi:hypothetical protein